VLLSLVFPAATYPQDVVAAEQWLVAAGTPTEADIAAQNWDNSIKGLVHYPTVLKMMSDQIDWTGCPDVDRDPGKCSGAWCVKGTRVMVQGILDNAEDCSAEEIAIEGNYDVGLVKSVIRFD
jgi:uncharacterized protein (DUF433 family)